MPFVNCNNVNVNFPMEPYTCQVDYMKKVVECLQKGVNGLLESPTGTGKTLNLLCASLAWLEDKKAQITSNRWLSMHAENVPEAVTSANNILANSLDNAAGVWVGDLASPKIIFASRTHSQLSQALKELKRTAYSHVKTCVIGSRDQLCVHPVVSKELSTTTKVHLCRSKIRNHTCHFYNNVENKKQEFSKLTLDIEDLVTNGKKHSCCPYFMAKELKNEADIIFMPYNYLLDPKARKAHNIEINGNVLIFDEAHNLEKICEDSVSFDLSSSDLALAIREVIAIQEKFVGMIENDQMNTSLSFDSQIGSNDLTLKHILSLKDVFLKLEKAIDAITLGTNGKGITKPGQYIYEIFSLANINFQTQEFVLDCCDKIMLYINNESSGMVMFSKGAGISKILDILRILFMGTSQQQEANPSSSTHYKVFVRQAPPKQSKSSAWNSDTNPLDGRVLSYWCFSSRYAMKELQQQGVRSIILTSGTLSPMNSFKVEMGIDFPIELSNPHVIDSSQVKLVILSNGPDGVVLNSSFQNRENVAYIKSLGATIVQLSRLVPGGMLIFFPSYPVMANNLQVWNNASDIGKRIEASKPIYSEPKSKHEFATTMSGFCDSVTDGNGAIFTAVCRGKVSEGLDFTDDFGRIVIITGLPFPPRMDPKVVLKMEFLDEKKIGLSGNQWYRQQASRAVNQAIGRVVRHKNDYGLILLCDERFQGASAQKELPGWLRSCIQVLKFSELIRLVPRFFRHASEHFSVRPRTFSAVLPQTNDFISVPALDTMGSMAKKGEIYKSLHKNASDLVLHKPPSEWTVNLMKQYKPLQNSPCFTKPKGLVDFCGTEMVGTNLVISAFNEQDYQVPLPQRESLIKQAAVNSRKRRKINVVPHMSGEKFGNKSDSTDTKSTSSKPKKTNDERLAFLSTAKHALGNSGYRILKQCLLDYSGSKSFDNMKPFLDYALARQNCHTVIISLSEYLSTSHRDEVLKLVDSYQQSKVTSIKIEGDEDKTSAPSDKRPNKEGQSSDTVTEKVICCVCNQTCSYPSVRALCRHVGCIDCWRKVISTTRKCPICDGNVKRKHLEAVFAMSTGQ